MFEKKARKRPNVPRPFRCKGFKPKKVSIIAYDFETSNLAPGTPRLKYITAFGAQMRLSQPVDSDGSLLKILEEDFLRPEFDGVRFVAWNANNFDVYFVAKALLLSNRWTMRPYLTRSKSLRGVRVYDKNNEDISWEFLDGISMTGIQRTLEFFLKIFAPDHQKMSGVIDWNTEEFDIYNPDHVAYADRDSEGLYYGLMRAQDIIFDTFKMYLTPTIGNLGIKIFQTFIPRTVSIEPTLNTIENIIRRWVVRGGFCYAARKFKGKIWKYDINQAYAAAMRECAMPSGKAAHVSEYWPMIAGMYRLSATHTSNKIPFYYRDNDEDSIFGFNEITDTWLTSVEVEQLFAEGWRVDITEGYTWSDSFSMVDYVDTLETIRMTCEGGPGGAIGLLMKAIGNNSYGKTLETLDGVDYQLCNECPDGFTMAPQASEDYELPIWVKREEPIFKDYHKPIIGAFITAHVRMEMRRAALIAPDAWLYGDTDCNAFSEPVALECHPSKYGLWKKEEQGEEFRIITKKVYAKVADGNKTFCELSLDEQRKHIHNNKNVQHAKGMNIKKLTDKDFENWLNGEAPEQLQLHKNNILKVMAGSEMFIERVRKGTKV